MEGPPLSLGKPLLLWDTGSIQRSTGDVGEQGLRWTRQQKDAVGVDTQGHSAKGWCGALRQRACPEAATLPLGPVGTSLSLQHSCLDGREDRPAVPLANTQARKSYQKATSLQK